MQKRFQILCLSGGGYLGLYTAAVLRRLEEDAGKPIGDCFDLIAGTSVGGIIALGLAAGTTAAEIERAFLDKGHEIFGSKPPRKTGAGRALTTFRQVVTHPFRASYSSEPLCGVIRSIIPKETTLGDLRRRVIIPAVNLTKGKPQVFKTPHHETFRRDWKLRVEDVALATSAAPTFFPAHEIDSELFADGGLYANSPDQLALHEASHFLKQSFDDVRLLSIGTTSASFSWSNASGKNLGWLDWAIGQRLIKALMASQQINVDYMTRHVLGFRYVRIDHEQSAEQQIQLGLDVASDTAKSDLVALANASVRDASAYGECQAFFDHNPERPLFFAGPNCHILTSQTV